MCNSKAKNKQTNKKQTKKSLGLVFKIQDDIWGKYINGEAPGRPIFKNTTPGFLQIIQEQSHFHPPFEVHGEGWGHR